MQLDAVTRLLTDPEAVVVEALPEIVALRRALRVALRQQAHHAALATALGRTSHDVRGALAPALLSAERLTGHDDPVVRQTGELVLTSIDRVTDLLRVSVDRLRAPRPVLATAPVALRPLLDEVAAGVGAVASAGADALPGQKAIRHGPVVHLEIAADLSIEADREAMRLVFVNLVRNAREAGATTVRLIATTGAAAIRIEIADDGPGVPAPIRDALRDPAPRDQGASAPHPGGGARPAYPRGPDLDALGLGLGIAHDFVVAAGGTLRLMETGPTGTVFAVTLPLKTRPLLRRP